MATSRSGRKRPVATAQDQQADIQCARIETDRLLAEGAVVARQGTLEHDPGRAAAYGRPIGRCQVITASRLRLRYAGERGNQQRRNGSWTTWTRAWLRSRSCSHA